jgi:hypothetical protein
MSPTIQVVYRYYTNNILAREYAEHALDSLCLAPSLSLSTTGKNRRLRSTHVLANSNVFQKLDQVPAGYNFLCTLQ